MKTIVTMFFIAFHCASCGSLGGDDGGGANLPNRGILGYEPEPAAALAAENASLHQPSVAASAAGLTMLYEAREASGTAIWRATSRDGGRTWGEQVRVLRGDDVAGDVVSAPSFIPGTDAEEFIFVVDHRSVLRARIDEEGTTVGEVLAEADAANAAQIAAPSLIQFSGQWMLYVEERRPSPEDAVGVEPSLSTIGLFLGTEIDSLSYAGTVLGANSGCVNATGADVSCWDERVGAPELRVATTTTGRTVLRMFYEGRLGRSANVGFAASYDGQTFERFPFNPLLETGKLAAPSNVLVDQSYLLFGERLVDGVGHIVVTRNDRGSVTETFH